MRSAALCIILVACSNRHDALQPLCFATPHRLVADLVADFNGDGAVDVLVQHSLDAPELRYGNGDGTFQAPEVMHGHQGFVRLGDFDGNGKPDLFSFSSGFTQFPPLPPQLHVSMNGAFATPSIAAELPGPDPLNPVGPSTALVGEFTGDGKLDIVVPEFLDNPAGAPRNRVSLFAGNGDGTFQARRDIPNLTGAALEDVALDFNGDGRTDLIHQGVVQLCSGDGVFTAASTLPYRFFVASGDIDGDGTVDLLLHDSLNGDGFTFGNGDGTFGPIVPRQGPTIAALGDMNGDGRADAIVAKERVLTVELGRGDGTFDATRDYWAPLLGAYERHVLVVDLNGDGNRDVIAGEGLSLGNGDGTLQSFPALRVSASTGTAIAMAAGNLDDDDEQEIVVRTDDDFLSVLHPVDGGRALAVERTLQVGRSSGAATIADIDGDSRNDLLVLTAEGVVVAPAIGDPFVLSMIPGQSFVDVYEQGGERMVVTGDLNTLHVVSAVTGSVMQEIATCDVRPSSDPQHPGPPTYPGPTHVADVNGDGRIDILAGTYCGTKLYTGAENGAFTLVLSAIPEHTSIAATGDFDGDGKLDIVVAVAEVGSSSVEGNIHLGRGDGTFETAAIAFPDHVMSVADFDDDGRDDLLTLDGIVSLDGTKIVTRATGIPAGYRPVPVELTGDGRLDLVVGAPGGIAAVIPSDCGFDLADPAPREVFCTGAADCPGEDTACATRACVADVCAVDSVPAGLTEYQGTGDCMRTECDGAGSLVLVPDDTDVLAGPCTTAGCSDGSYTDYAYVPAGTPCGSGGQQCTGGGVCQVPSLAIVVSHGVDQEQVWITDAGGGIVASCASSCSVPVTPGQTYTVHAANPASISPAPQTIVASVENVVQVAFDTPINTWFFYGAPGETFVAVAHTTNGDVIAGSGTRLVRLDADDGAIVWSKLMPVSSIAIGAASEIYVLSGTTLKKLDGDGTELWSRAAAACPSTQAFMTCLIVAPNGDVVFGGPRVMQWQPDGTLRFDHPPQAGWDYNAVAIKFLPPSTSAAMVLRYDASLGGVVGSVFDSDGSALPDVVDRGPLGNQYWPLGPQASTINAEGLIVASPAGATRFGSGRDGYPALGWQDSAGAHLSATFPGPGLELVSRHYVADQSEMHALATFYQQTLGYQVYRFTTAGSFTGRDGPVGIVVSYALNGNAQ